MAGGIKIGGNKMRFILGIFLSLLLGFTITYAADVSLNWLPAEGNVIYKVETKKPLDTAWTLLNEVSVTNYTDLDVDPNTVKCYRVTAMGEKTQSLPKEVCMLVIEGLQLTILTN